MAARRRRRRAVKRTRGSTVKTKLGGVIKSLQDIKKHVGTPTITRKPKRRKASAKRLRFARSSPIYHDTEENLVGFGADFE